MNQHYVPRCYLKNFAKQKGREFYVDVYDNNSHKYFNTNIKNICSEKHLYTLDQNQNVANDVLAMEKMYSNHFEPMFIKSYNLLINDRFTRMNEMQRAEITLGLFHLYMRNPHFAYNSINQHSVNIRRMYLEAISQGKKGITYLDEDFSFREWDEESIIKFFEEKILKTYKEKHVYGIKEMSERHLNAAIEVIKIIDDSEFITCDRPFSMKNQLSNDDNPLERSQEFTLTLNLKYAVRIYHDLDQPWDTIVRNNIPNGNAALINATIEKHSEKYLIGKKSSIEAHFKMQEFMNDTSLDLKIDLIKQFLTKIPENDKNIEMKNLLRKYLDKYEEEGTLSKSEVYELSLQIKQIKNKAIKLKIGTR